jgi:hypothetical protein
MLLRHVGDSIETLNEAIATGQIDLGYPRFRGRPETDALTVLRARAVRLLESCAAVGAEDGIAAIGGRELSRRKVALAGAIELTIHGWDIRAACGAFRPIPPLLACILLPVAPLIVTPGARPELFADAIQLPGPALQSDQLVAFLGRQPHWTATPATA